MKTIILAGGYGTRLSEETETLPKPMIELGGHPLLWHIMHLYSAHGFDDFILALGYKGDVIKRYFLQYPQVASDLRIDMKSGVVTNQTGVVEKWKIDLIDTGHDTMTGGRLTKLRNNLTKTFFLTYGDGLSNIDLRALLSFHRSHGKLVTVTAVKPQPRFGVLEIDGDDVVEFNEKSRDNDRYINGGFFVVEPAALDYIDGDQIAWEREPCQRLAHDGQLAAYRHDGYWQCVDTLHELRQLRDVWNSGNAPWKTWD